METDHSVSDYPNGNDDNLNQNENRNTIMNADRQLRDFDNSAGSDDFLTPNGDDENEREHHQDQPNIIIEKESDRDEFPEAETNTFPSLD